MTAASRSVALKGSAGFGGFAAALVAGVAVAVIGLAISAGPVVAPASVGGNGSSALPEQSRTYHTTLLEKHHILSTWDPYHGK